jgi:hypothetical protein
MNFDWVIFLYFLSLSSLCVIYPTGRSVHIKEQIFFLFLLSVKVLFEADPFEV